MDRETIMEVSSRKIGKALMIGLPLLAMAVCAPMIFEDVKPDELTVIQAPFTGKLTWHTTQGWAWQGFGTVTTYKKRVTYQFPPLVYNNKGEVVGGGLELRFKDGGHARMYGSVQFVLPEDPERLTKLHSNYRGQDIVTQNLFQTTVNKSVYLVGTLMTSKESYAEKRNDLIHYATDQIQEGVYRTRQKTEYIVDELTKQSKQVISADIILGKDGKPERQEDSIIGYYGIRTVNFTIEKMPYDDAIEQQIRQQQSITMAVQTSIAEAQQAEQRALTATANGKADAEKAKWEQETIKAREVTKAEQERQVAVTHAQREKEVLETQAAARLAAADLDTKAAALQKQREILLGEGEAQRRKLVLEADGALAQKLEAWLNSQKAWANALAQFKGQIVPSTVMGSNGSGGSNNGVQSFMDIMTLNAAKQLELNMDMRK